MNRTLVALIAATAALLVTAPVPAHHSISMFEIASPIWVKGTVATYEPINPHAVILLEPDPVDDTGRRWVICSAACLSMRVD